METLDYRGIHVEFIADDPGQQVVGHFTNLDIADVRFGAYNTMYVEVAKSLIDFELDTISYIQPGGRLSWFTNVFSGKRDMKLEFRSRIYKVWHVDDADHIDVEALKTESTKICEELEADRLASKEPGTRADNLIRNSKN